MSWSVLQAAVLAEANRRKSQASNATVKAPTTLQTDNQVSEEDPTASTEMAVYGKRHGGRGPPGASFNSNYRPPRGGYGHPRPPRHFGNQSRFHPYGRGPPPPPQYGYHQPWYGQSYHQPPFGYPPRGPRPGPPRFYAPQNFGRQQQQQPRHHSTEGAQAHHVNDSAATDEAQSEQQQHESYPSWADYWSGAYNVEAEPQPDQQSLQHWQLPAIALLSTDTVRDPHEFIVDSGCTNHCVFEEKLFTDMKPCDLSIKVGDNATVPVVGIGTIHFKIHSNCVNGNQPIYMSLSNCFYVPKIARNLLSVTQLRMMGVLFDFNKYIDRVELRKGPSVVTTLPTDTRLYLLRAAPFNEVNTTFESYYVASRPTMHLWHQRLGHPSHPKLLQLLKDGFSGLPSTADFSTKRDICDTCERANATRASFTHVGTVATAVLDRVATDIKGPIECASIDGYRYVLIFVDDYSGYVCTYLLRHKSDAFSKLREYVQLVQNKFGKKIVTLQSDNGGEYISTAWTQYCTDNGIHLTSTVAYTPEQNGLAEVRFRILFRKVRALLMDAELPKQLWSFALRTAVHLYNLTPTRRTALTPWSRWHPKDPHFGSLRVFGSDNWN